MSNINSSIDIKQCEILNGVAEPSLESIFSLTTSNNDSDSDSDLESKVIFKEPVITSSLDDPQIIIKIGFHSSVFITSVILTPIRGGANPKKIELYIDKPNLSFNDLDIEKPVVLSSKKPIKATCLCICIISSTNSKLPTSVGKINILGSVGPMNSRTTVRDPRSSTRVNRLCERAIGRTVFSDNVDPE